MMCNKQLFTQLANPSVAASRVHLERSETKILRVNFPPVIFVCVQRAHLFGVGGRFDQSELYMIWKALSGR
jgi:hypothetical protein